MGDGSTCVEQPVFEFGPSVPEDVANNNCQQGLVADRRPVTGNVAGNPLDYCLQVTSGQTYTIAVTLLGLSDSVLELWTSGRSPEMIDS